MSAAEKTISANSDNEFENEQDEYIVSDMTKLHHFMIVGIGILPFVIASIWYSITF